MSKTLAVLNGIDVRLPAVYERFKFLLFIRIYLSEDEKAHR
jgi:hypothetical protein